MRATLKVIVFSSFLAIMTGCNSSSNGNGNGNGELDTQPPHQPNEITATPGNSEVKISWDTVANAEGYHLYYATESGLTPENYGAYQNGTWLQNATSPYVVSGLTNGVKYYFTVTAYNSNGESSDGAEVTGTPVEPAQVESRPLNDTGIDWCADDSNNNLSCPVAGYPGQDAEHGRDAQARASTLSKVGAGAAGFDFTKLDANGNSLSASATSWSCVKDNHTGLIWEVKTTGGVSLQHRGNAYTWYNPDNNSNGGSAGAQNGGTCVGSQCDTQGYVQAVNQQSLCGASDWRMPTVGELYSIAHLGRTSPAIDTAYFPNTPSVFFWSASPTALVSDGAWYVSFGSGSVNWSPKEGNLRVRLVRGGQ